MNNGIKRREFMVGAVSTAMATSLITPITAEAGTAGRTMRAINIMNFIRAEEPRQPMDLFLPVKEQMALIKQHRFPATWLFQYDALVSGPFVDFIKTEMPTDHETGLWLEMNRKLCDDAGVAWRGRPGWGWDWHVPIAYLMGYTPDARRKLADTAMATHQRVFGRPAKTVACWNLDAFTMAHLSDRYGIDAFGNCRDQLATDGFTLWGGPITAYYPSRKNGLSPAVGAGNQINSPVFRLLGQDPVYYYDNQIRDPDTMEPVWPSGQSDAFIKNFLDMTARVPTQSIAYAQLGQENSFGWPMMQGAYPKQMQSLAELRAKGEVVIETMGETGRRFKRTFRSTPTQAQVMLVDPFDKTQNPERTVWYQSKHHRVNLHFRGDNFYLRDLHVYSDGFPELYGKDPVRQHGIEQRMLAALDGYHWSDRSALAGRAGTRAAGEFVIVGPGGDEQRLMMAGLPRVSENGTTTRASVPLTTGGDLVCEFSEREIAFRLIGVKLGSRLALVFRWAAGRSALQSVETGALWYRFRDFDYVVRIAGGAASKTSDGAKLIAYNRGALRLIMVQAT